MILLHGFYCFVIYLPDKPACVIHQLQLLSNIQSYPDLQACNTSLAKLVYPDCHCSCIGKHILEFVELIICSIMLDWDFFQIFSLVQDNHVAFIVATAFVAHEHFSLLTMSPLDSPLYWSCYCSFSFMGC